MTQLSLLGGAVPRLAPVRALLADPCSGCPRASAPRVPPSVPPAPRLAAVGMAPGGEEEKAGAPFVGRGGRLLRSALADAGLDPSLDAAYLNLGRCRPEGDDFGSPAWAEAERRCRSHLERDLAPLRGAPLLLLGSRPLQRFAGDARASVRRQRGLWRRLADGRDAFAALHPAGVLRAGDPGTPERDRLEAQFRADLVRMADRVLGREVFPPVKFDLWDLREKAGRAAVARLALAPWPWFFDIETMDAGGIPSRPGVATDPFHPDFRVRGVSVAWGPGDGAWIELAWAEDGRKDEVRAALDPAFGSGAEKGAFVSGFDANGLIAQGWVGEVRNLARDPWLAAIALDTKGGGHSLERLAVDVLGEPQPLGKGDRGRIREMPLERVAEYAVRDACLEYRLDVVLQKRLELGEYL